jgi:D-beta-D-heptose 7-phosphate kinase/D-beta-D-heptose 1-phosphate adenosyltransferase
MEKTKILVICSGYFNPIHKGHIEYLKRSKELGTYLYVIVNNDLQREMKGSRPFMEAEERKLIVESLKFVDEAMVSIDDDRMVNRSIKWIMIKMGHQFDLVYFANGGDQNKDTIGETQLCNELGIHLVDNLGDKIQSSSKLIKDSNEFYNRK